MTYEEMTARLETILKTLEQGQVPLADIMTLFQEAKKLSQDIEKLLAQYEAIFNS
ncbi:MAG: exodeoxyribonuclease VII small subunit [Sulfobacillus sp.]